LEGVEEVTVMIKKAPRQRVLRLHLFRVSAVSSILNRCKMAVNPE
jgi:hypothetical protein